MQLALRVNSYTNYGRWYTRHRDALVPLVSICSDGFFSREPEGHKNIIPFNDAIIEVYTMAIKNYFSKGGAVSGADAGTVVSKGFNDLLMQDLYNQQMNSVASTIAKQASHARERRSRYDPVMRVNIEPVDNGFIVECVTPGEYIGQIAGVVSKVYVPSIDKIQDVLTVAYGKLAIKGDV
jgi:hypothetical protein